MVVGDAYVFPGFLTPVLTQLFFLKPLTTFLTCFCRGERRKYAGKKVASTGDRTHNHQVISPTCSPLSHLGGALTEVRLRGLPKFDTFRNCHKAPFRVIGHKCIILSEERHNASGKALFSVFDFFVTRRLKFRMYIYVMHKGSSSKIEDKNRIVAGRQMSRLVPWH